MDDSDMFDLDVTESTGKTYYIFGTSNRDDTEFDNNAPYIIKGNSSRKQDFKEYTVWTLEFITYNSLNSVKYTNNNAEVQKSLKNYQIAKKKAVAKSKATTKSKLSKCKLTYLKYSSKKKTIACVKYMQLILYKKGYLTKSQVDGWFGKKTTLALKKFQKKYKKKYKLKVTGKVDKATLNALVKA